MYILLKFNVHFYTYSEYVLVLAVLILPYGFTKVSAWSGLLPNSPRSPHIFSFSGATADKNKKWPTITIATATQYEYSWGLPSQSSTPTMMMNHMRRLNMMTIILLLCVTNRHIGQIGMVVKLVGYHRG